MGYLCIGLGERAAMRKAALRTIVSAIGDDRGTPFRQPDQIWNGTARPIVKIMDLSSLWNRSCRSPDRNWLEALRPEPPRWILIFAYNDRNPETGECEYFDWCGLKDFHDPSGFGEIGLAGRNTLYAECRPRPVTGVRTIS
jgi:hypothetical protein